MPLMLIGVMHYAVNSWQWNEPQMDTSEEETPYNFLKGELLPCSKATTCRCYQVGSAWKDKYQYFSGLKALCSSQA